jgi:xanthine dehydrogenase accessory factor
VPGARLLVDPAADRPGIERTLGDPALDQLAADEGTRALEDGRSSVVELGEDVRAFVEVIVPPIRLLVCGAGHDAIPLVRFAAGLGWRVEMIDDRDAFLKPHRFPDAARLVKAEPIHGAAQAGVDDRTYVVVMSHNSLRDKDYLRSFLGTPARYIGMLGPRERLDRLFTDLARDGFHPADGDLDVVHGPAGLDLGGDGPDEVAWAILAEVLAVSKGRTGGPLRDRRGPIHDRPRAPEGSLAPGSG